MKRHLYTFALAALMSGIMMAQGPPAGSTPPTFPPDQQRIPPTPSEAQQPTEPPPAPASSTADLQNKVQEALHRQLPASADQVKVSVADDGSLELTGTVATDRERQQIEDVARSAAPNHAIVDNLKVSGSVSGSGMSWRGSGLPQADQQQGVEKPKTGQTITPPNRGDEDWPQTGSSTTHQNTTNPEAAMTPSSPNQASTGAQNSQSPVASQNPSASQSGQTSALPQSDQAINNLQGSIQSALQQDPALANSSVAVNVTANEVELTGTVPDKHARKTAEDIAKTNAGGRRVVDHIKISSSSSAAKPY